MVLRKMILNWSEFTVSEITFAILSVSSFAFFTYLCFKAAIIRHKYFIHNLKEETKLDKQTEKIIVFNKLNKKQTEINFSDVNSVELFYSWNANPFSSDLGYSKLNIKNKENPLIITQNNINQYHIYKVFKNKITKNKSKFMNDIKYN